MEVALKIPEGFVFSQNNLQDFIDCPRRFELRWLQHLDWPAAEAEPIEENRIHMQRGSTFHQLIQQDQLSIDVTSYLNNLDFELQQWFRNYRSNPPIDHSLPRAIEVSYSIPFMKYRLLAKYDAVVKNPDGKLILIDWKTNNRKTSRQALTQRMQTKVYPFVLKEALGIDAETIQLIYWFTSEPEKPELFNYSAAEHAATKQELVQTIEAIEQCTRSGFLLTADTRKCSFCVYRSYCDRGKSTGDMDADDAESLDPIGGIDRESLLQSAEIEF